MRATTLGPVLTLGLLAVFPGVASASEGAAREDHPPKITLATRVEPAISDASGGIDPVLRSGRTARITFSAEDPDGEVLKYAVAPLPAGATFDPQQGVLTWQPTRDQEGKQEVTLEVSDGNLTTRHMFTFLVRPNRAPTADRSEPVTYKIGRAAGNAPEQEQEAPVFLAQDPDSDEITCELRKAPPGARVVVNHNSAVLLWSATAAAVGEHEIVVDVSDGELRTTIRKTIVVMAEWEAHDYHRWLLIGGGPSAFLSHGNGEVFLGGTVDITFAAVREGGMAPYACARGSRTYDCHASHHRFYAEFAVLDSTRSGAPSLFTYGAGYSASLEWRPARRYLIPHYGIDAGGLVRAGVGHRAQVHPYLGLHLWASDNLWLNATLGYRVTPAELLDLSGPTFALSAILNPW
jgi:hypothetical protein